MPIDMSRISVSASSNESTVLAPDGIIEELPGSRWSSAWSEPQWFMVDLGAMTPISSIGISWEGARATHYGILLSADGTTWEEAIAFSNLPGDNLWDSAVFPLAKQARFIKLDCRKRFKQNHGFSIFQIWVNGERLQRPLPEVKIEALDAPFRKSSLPAEARAADLLGRLTFEELLLLTGGYSAFYIAPLRRFGLPAIRFSDASMGVRFNETSPANKSTSFPAFVALAATWNPDLARAYGLSLGEECRAHGIGTLLGPGVNIYRASTCGRNFEYLGEDPCLTSRMAVNYITGLQSTGVMACVKHFACNNHEFIRHDSNAVVDDQTFHEIYLPAFKAAIEEANVMAVMTAYNYWKGEKASQNRELIEGVLKGELGFKNLVMSDWGAVWDGEKVMASGQDLVMPDNGMVRRYVEAHPEKKVEIESHLKRMAANILRVNFLMGFYDRPVKDDSFLTKFPEHQEVALATGREAVTLLQNKGMLPLDAKKGTTILLCGPAAEKTPRSGGGSGFVTGYDNVSYLEGFRKEFGEAVRFSENPTDEEIAKAGAVFVCPYVFESEGSDRWFELPADQEALILRAIALNHNTAVVVTQGSGIRMTDWVAGANAIVQAYYLGQCRGTVLAEVVSGKVNPSGKLPFSIEKNFADSPSADYLPSFVMAERNASGLTEHSTTKNLLQKHGVSLPHNLEYREGLFVGYRWYDGKNIAPLFHFGHGLSYTSFAYEHPAVNAAGNSAEPNVTVSFVITNTGKRTGSEIAQVYVSPIAPGRNRPKKELKGFAKVTLAPGEKKRVSLVLDKNAFAFYDVKAKAWKVEPGEFEVLIGASSRDIRLKAQVRVGSF